MQRSSVIGRKQDSPLLRFSSLRATRVALALPPPPASAPPELLAPLPRLVHRSLFYPASTLTPLLTVFRMSRATRSQRHRRPPPTHYALRPCLKEWRRQWRDSPSSHHTSVRYRP